MVKRNTKPKNIKSKFKKNNSSQEDNLNEENESNSNDGKLNQANLIIMEDEDLNFDGTDHITDMYNHLLHNDPLPEYFQKMSEQEIAVNYCKGINNPKLIEDKNITESQIKTSLKVINSYGFYSNQGWFIHRGLPTQFQPQLGDNYERVLHKLQLAYYSLIMRENCNLHEQFLQMLEPMEPGAIHNCITAAYSNVQLLTSIRMDSPTTYFNNRLEPSQLDADGNDIPTTPSRDGSLPETALDKEWSNDEGYSNVRLDKPSMNTLDGDNINVSGTKFRTANVPLVMQGVDKQLSDLYEESYKKDKGYYKNSVQVFSTKSISHLICSNSLPRDKIRQIIIYANSELHSPRDFDFGNHFTGHSKTLLTMMLCYHHLLPDDQVDKMTWWNDPKISQQEVLKWLEKLFPVKEEYVNISALNLVRSAIETASVKFQCDFRNVQAIKTSIEEPMAVILGELGDISGEDGSGEELYKLFIRKLKGIKRPYNYSVDPFIINMDKLKSKHDLKVPRVPLRFQHVVFFIQVVIKSFIDACQPLSEDWRINDIPLLLQKAVKNHSSYEDDSYRPSVKHTTNTTNNSNRDVESRRIKQIDKKDSHKEIANSGIICQGCGKQGHELGKCRLRDHPDFNNSGEPWNKCNSRARLLKRFPNKSLKEISLSSKWSIDGILLESSIDHNPTKKSKIDHKKSKTHEGKLLSHIDTIYNTEYNVPFNTDLILIHSSVQTGDANLPVDTLIDSGASANYISEEIAAWIMNRQEDNKLTHACKLSVEDSNSKSISVLANTQFTIESKGLVSCDFIFFNELTKCNVILPCLTFKIIKTGLDIIIGLPVIRKYRLASKLPSVFNGINVVEPRPHPNVETHLWADPEGLPESNFCVDNLCSSCDHAICHPCADKFLGTLHIAYPNTYTFGLSRASSSGDDHIKNPDVLRTFPARLSAVHGAAESCCRVGHNGPLRGPNPSFKPSVIHRREFLGEKICDDEIEEKPNILDSLTTHKTNFSPSDDILDLITIDGPPELRSRLRTLCEEYREIFSTSVRKEPAKVPSMKFTVDEAQWSHKRSRLPARKQPLDKQKEIYAQLKKLLELDIIEVSTASEWSQVHMVPKPNTINEWRMTIDFVKLNEATKGGEGWPITLIDALFQRLGDRKHKYFGVLDLTQGYFQGALAPENRAHTAFMTLNGLYQWKRCPMGLKSAGSYFQRVMSSTVLAGLAHKICELYIDDVLISGENEEQYLTNVKAVFQRFRDFGVVVHPKKAKLGLSELEYVGHVVDSEGLHFSKEKRIEVLNFPRPTIQKHVQMFLGLANYFRDHVANITELLAPLRELIVQYERRKKIMWTPERIEAFDKAKQAIHDCQKLYFIDPAITPILQTNASDYGIGGMLYQMKNGKMFPIRYISKSLQGSQLNWSTIEKECYAIFFCIQKLKPLLGSSHFMVKTDHKNLTFLKEHEKNCKVTRWKHALMEEDFSIEHVPGIEYNQQVPDALSRLVRDPRIPIDELFSLGNYKSRTKMLELISALKIKHPRDKLNLIMKNNAEHIDDKIYQNITKFHNSEVGHYAWERVYKRMQVANAIDFDNPRKWIREYIKQCPCCQLMDRLKLRVKIRPFLTSSLRPFETVCLDHIGPLHIDGKPIYILVVIDCFSRWVELYPVETTTAIETADCLFNFYGRYGSAETISTDRGPAFHNEIVQQLVELGGSDYQFTTAYSHEENGIIERHNAEVMRHLRAIMFDKRVTNTVTKFLPIVQRIMNTLERVSTGVTPAELIFGNNLRLESRILEDNRSKSIRSEVPLAKYMDNLLKQQEKILIVARETQKARDTHRMQEKHPDYIEYPINSYVLYTPPIGKRRPKTEMKHDGPFLVVNRLGDIYTIQHQTTGKPFDTHVSALRPFFYDPLRINPKDVAIANAREFYIDRILLHRGDINKKTSMEFLVRWLGYTEDDDSWEPFGNLRDTDQLLTYLRSNPRLVKLIDPKHR